MLNNINKLAIAIISLLLAQSAFADIKVKSKQTMSGQSYESTTYIKGKRQRSESMAGMVSITQCDLRRSVQINSASKTYMVNPFADKNETVTKSSVSTGGMTGVVKAGGRVTTTIATKDTGERKQVFGFAARHLIITMETVSSPDACIPVNTKIQTDGWYIDAAFALDCDFGYNPQSWSTVKSGGCQDKYEMKTTGLAKRGFPVFEKMTMFDESGKETYSMVSEVVEISKAALDAGLFEIPDGYREVADAAQMYSISTGKIKNDGDSTALGFWEISDAANGNKALAANSPDKNQPIKAKTAGTVRIGLAVVKTGIVGERVKPADLSAAVRNTLIQYLKASNVEIVNLESREPTAIKREMVEKDCDYLIETTVSHKKGGGFGMLKSLEPMLAGVVPISGGATSHASGTVASHGIISSAGVSADIKAKDEITLELSLLETNGVAIIENSFKGKAKADRDDILSRLVAEAANAIVETVRKS